MFVSLHVSLNEHGSKVTDGRNTTCRRFHFVHVGKNGGTALESWLTENHLECLIAPISFGHVDMEVVPHLHIEHGFRGVV